MEGSSPLSSRKRDRENAEISSEAAEAVNIEQENQVLEDQFLASEESEGEDLFNDNLAMFELPANIN